MIIYYAAVVVAIVLFLLGFYTGLWIARHSREVVEREVPKVVTTEKVVEIERPVLVQVPTPVKPNGTGPALATMGQPNRSVIVDPVERAQLEHIQQLTREPEAG